MNISDELLEQYMPEARNLWLKTMPQEREYEFSPEFEAKMRKLLEEQRQPRRKKARVWLRRLTAAAACLAVALTAVCSLSLSQRRRLSPLQYLCLEGTNYP